MQTIKLRTGIWYNDHAIELRFPLDWDVRTYWPDTPPVLSVARIKERLNSPMGQPPLRELAKGKRKPLIIVDDLSRPTPVYQIMPLLLEEFGSAGIPAENIRILVAAGTHGNQNHYALEKKIGREAFGACQIIVHNDKKKCRLVGRTSYATPVYVNPAVLDSDLVCGVGGIYPQHTTGFGGGSKLALGVLGRKSIVHLHYGKHKSVAGTYNIENTFRRDLDEIARIIGLSTIFTLHIDGCSQLVNLTCGDHFAYYPEAAAFSRKAYAAPLPHDADVVIANTYPSDISYTFMRKGLKPVRCATPDAVRIAVGYNYEGIGRHGIFPQGKNQRLNQMHALFLRMSTMDKKEIIAKLIKNLSPRSNKMNPPQPHAASAGTILSESLEGMWLYRPEGESLPLPEIDGIRITRQWESVLEHIEKKFANRQSLRVAVYPCAPLQCLEHAGRKN